MRLDTWTIAGSSFHFGRHGLGQEETNASFSSDSLFSALVARLARTNGAQAAEDFGKQFLGDPPPFVLTSTFPKAGSVRFFPVPAHARRGEAGGANAKQLKGVSHISEQLFRQVIAGKALADLFPQAAALQEGLLLLAREEMAGLPQAQRDNPRAPLWMVEQRPRVTLARASNQSNIFFTARLVFAPDCGLWFGVRFLDGGQLKPSLEGMLQDLSEAGLGAERSIGFGACTIQPAGALNLPDKEAGPWTSLSRYLPQADETAALAHPTAAYSFRTVSGWLDSPVHTGQRRKTVNLLAEGSVFGPLARMVPGQVVDARPVYPTNHDPVGHPVYRCGLALAVGLQGDEI